MTSKRRLSVDCDLSALAADLASVDALARLSLGARRAGIELRLRDASEELRELVANAGLSEVLGLESVGQTKEREERLGIEEEGELDYPVP